MLAGEVYSPYDKELMQLHKQALIWLSNIIKKLLLTVWGKRSY